MAELDAATESLDAAAIAAVDASDQLADILDLPEHLRDGLWRVESAELVEHDSPGGLVVAGMGGSGVAGALARAALGDQASRPIFSARGYGLPASTTPDTTVLCVSYSGETEETLAAYDAAGALGAHRVVVTTGGRLAELARADAVPIIALPGGFPPRAAVGYTTVAALEVAAMCGAGPRMASEIDVAAAHLEHLCGEWHPDVPEDRNAAKRLARALHATVPVIVGAGLTTPIARRWKTQFNANAKMQAFAAELPELDHNELEAWQPGDDGARCAAVFLEDSDTHPRIAQRVGLTIERIAGAAATTQRIDTVGQGAVERVMSLVLLGDIVSIYLAALRGVDPTRVPVIDGLKTELRRR